MRFGNRDWILLACATAVVVALFFIVDPLLGSGCQASYAGQRRVIGTEFTPLGVEYSKQNPTASKEELLFDAGGAAERVWTPQSIARCRLALNASTAAKVILTLGIVLLAVRVLNARRFPWRRLRKAAALPVATAGVHKLYDAFISYRHQEPDISIARDLLNRLEQAGFRIAIDARDFRPNEHFLDEMERCIKESRYTLCIVTGAYIQSDNCNEEAVISKVLDLRERKRRLVPLLYERVELPVWLYGLVGIDFGAERPLVDPLEKLKNHLARTDGAVAN